MKLVGGSTLQEKNMLFVVRDLIRGLSKAQKVLMGYLSSGPTRVLEEGAHASTFHELGNN